MKPSDRSVGHILIADDEGALATMLSQHLERLGHRVTTVTDGRAALAALAAGAFDVALLDMVMPAPDGLEVLRALADDPDPPAVIIAAAQGTIDVAVQAMRLGAFAYVSKPYRVAELDVVIARAIEHRVLTHTNIALRAQVARAEGAPEFLTQYAPLRAVFAAAQTAAALDAPVLIAGAPGTGKCALAHAMHARSTRAGRPFVQMEQGALAGPDAEPMLFGAERTPAAPRPRPALATRGTLYLHDVVALPHRLQRRLAAALKDGKYRSAPHGEDRVARARMIAGANACGDTVCGLLHAELAAVVSATMIVLPPLRERAVDIPLLAASFLASAGDARPLRFDDDAMTSLQSYDWPGNVAELRAVVERARLLARDGVIRVTDLSLSQDADNMELGEVERRHIEAVLQAKAWHQGKAADTLGISPKTLYRKIREFGLKRPSGGDAA